MYENVIEQIYILSHLNGCDDVYEHNNIITVSAGIVSGDHEDVRIRCDGLTIESYTTTLGDIFWGYPKDTTKFKYIGFVFALLKEYNGKN